MDIHVGLEPLRDLDALANDWTALEKHADASLFQSWLWIGTWAELVAPHVDLIRLTARTADGQIVALALFGSHGRRSRALHLNTTGRRLFDHLNAEHNGLLVAREDADLVRERCLEFLVDGVRRGDYRRVLIPGVPPPYADVPGSFVRRRELSHVVDLAAVRHAGDYTALLGSRTRKNMRRSRRAYEADGATMTFELATTTTEALRYLDRLSDLHETAWQAQGWHGSFANSFYRSFHSEFVRRGLDGGLVQLSRLTAGSREIGYMYNLCHRGRVYAYQAGLRFEDDSVFQPGRMCEWAAIEHSARAGLDVYDLLSGDTQYKRSLGTDHEERVWAVIQRSNRLEPARAAALSGLRALRVRLPRPARALAEKVVAAARSRAARGR